MNNLLSTEISRYVNPHQSWNVAKNVFHASCIQWAIAACFVNATTPHTVAKKAAHIESVRYPEVLDCALCFGWIDGRREALDDNYFLQRFTPRRPRSNWSRINDSEEQRCRRN